MVPPISLVTWYIRRRMNGASPSPVLSTRFAICTPAKVTGGSSVLPPVLPVRWMDSSHIGVDIPSPEAGKPCSKVQESTSLWTPPVSTFVVMVESLLRDQKVGECWSLHSVAPSLQ
ncbi:hypothetical protein SMICM17S_04800 [Streptomyces microflavus]